MHSLHKLSAKLGRRLSSTDTPVGAAVRALCTPKQGSDRRPSSSDLRQVGWIRRRSSATLDVGESVRSPRRSPRIQLLQSLLASNKKWAPDRTSPLQRVSAPLPVFHLTPPQPDEDRQTDAAECHGSAQTDSIYPVIQSPSPRRNLGTFPQPSPASSDVTPRFSVFRIDSDGESADKQDGDDADLSHVAFPSPIALALPSNVKSTPGGRVRKFAVIHHGGVYLESPVASAPNRFPDGETRVPAARLRRRLFVTSTKHDSPFEPRCHDNRGVTPPDDDQHEYGEIEVMRGGEAVKSSPSCWKNSPVFAYSTWLPVTPGARKVVQLDTPVRDSIQQTGMDALPGKPLVLGRGGFGVVVQGIYRGQQVALKILSRPTRRRHLVEASLRGERNALCLRHPNIVRTLFVSRAPQERFAVVVMEMAGGGHLANLLENPVEKVDERRRLRFAYQVALAIQWCHSQQIVHLDVKPANVIVDGQDRCKLGDFGCSMKLNEFYEVSRQAEFLGGTVAYRAPELFSQCLPSAKADVYSFGVTLWQLLARQTPYKGMDPHTIVYKVGAGNMRPATMKSVGSQGAAYVALYEKLWIAGASKRPTIDYAVGQIIAMMA